MTTLNTLVPRVKFRSISQFQPDTLNALLSELIRDVNTLTQSYNTVVLPALSSLPLGSQDADNATDDPIGNELDGVANGISGDQIWTDDNATSSSSTLFFNGRKLTIKETALKLNSKIDDAIALFQQLLNSSADGVSAYSKAYIGTKAFDSSLTSSAGSMDGRIGKLENNEDQIAVDSYGPNYTLNNDGAVTLNYPLSQLVDELLAFFNGAAYQTGLTYDNPVSLSLQVLTSDIQLDAGGLIPQTYIDQSNTYTEESRSTTAANLEEDLNRIRWEITHLRGSTAFNNDTNVAAYGGGPTSLAGHMADTGSGTVEAGNPHGTDLADLDSWGAVISAVQSFTGMDSATDGSPAYSTHGPTSIVNDGDSVEKAIQALDEVVSVVAGGQPAGHETLRWKDFSKMVASGPTEGTLYTSMSASGVVHKVLNYATGADEYAMTVLTPPTDASGILPTSLELVTSWLPDPLGGASGDVFIEVAYSITTISGVEYGLILNAGEDFGVTWGLEQQSAFTVNSDTLLKVIQHTPIDVTCNGSSPAYLTLRIGRVGTDPHDTLAYNYNLISADVIWRW